MAGARMELTGQEETLALLGEAIGRTEDKRGLFDAIGAALVSSTQSRFETETDPEGNPWPDSIRKLTLGGRTLTETAALAQSITHEPTESSVAVGTNLIYAAIHQLGGIIRPVTAQKLAFRLPGGGFAMVDEVEMPARPFLGLDQDDEAEIRALAADWLGAEEDGSAPQ